MKSEFVRNIVEKNFTEAKSQFKEIMAEKVMEKMAMEKIEVAKTLFTKSK